MGLNNEQLQAVNSNSDRILCLAGAGAGKALRNSTKVKTPNGDIAIEDLCVGDKVFSSDGNAHQVLGVYPQGKKSVVRITFSDRNYIDCSEDHLWIYQTKSMRDHHKGFDVKTTKELMDIPLKKKSGDNFVNNLYIPVCSPCLYDEVNVPIDPYLLGLLIGDGGLSQTGVQFSNTETDILDYVKNAVSQYGCHLTQYDDVTYGITKNENSPTKPNILWNSLQELGLNCKSIDKHIPSIYKYNSPEIRLALLNGLIDTDGCVSHSMYEFSTASKNLATDIVELVESLGMTCTLADRDSKYVKDNIRVDLDHKNYRVFIKPSNLYKTLHRSEKHTNSWKSIGHQTYARRYITSMEYLGIDAEMTCIAVDSPDSSFLTEHYIVTHNTKSFIERISRLVQDGVAPSSILALTFTNAAAAEMRSRYEDKNIGKEIPEFRTFHSFCYSVLCKDPAVRSALGYEGVPGIATDEQEKAIEDKAKIQCKITISDEKLKSRTGLTKKEQFQVDLYDKAVKRLMRSENLITFDRLNSEVAELFASNDSSTNYYKDKYKHILVDECLPKDMSVITDNGWYSIDRLYDDYMNNKELPLVKSYNLNTAEYEYKPIIGALKSDNREVFEIHTEGLNKIRCTSKHKIYTQRGYVEAKDLIVGQDMVILDSPNKQKTKYLLNADQYQICLGSYLGDGCACKQSKFFTYRLNFTQGIKQQDYFMSKISAFGLTYHTGKSGYTGESTILSSNYTPTFALNADIFDCVLAHISPMGLAIWYQDDGSLNLGKYPVICAGSFSYEQTCKLTIMLMDRFDLEATPWVDGKGYSNIRFTAKSGKRFLELISPYMHPSMQYKTTVDISNNQIKYDPNYLNIGANFIDKISSVGTDTVYDLTIADNHNFIVSSRAHRVDSKTGTIVHNCQDTDRHQMRFLDSFPHTDFYFCGDCLQNIYAFRGTSNEYIKALANTPDWEKIKLFTNYRSTNQICAYANEFSASYADASYRIEMQGIRDGEKVITKRVEKPSRYDAISTEDIDDVLNEISSLQGTSAILCRTNKEVYAITAYLKENGIEFTSGKDNKFQKLIECALSDTYLVGYLAAQLPSAKYGEYIRLSAKEQNPDLAWFIGLYGRVSQVSDVYSIVMKLREIAISQKFTNVKLNQVEELLNMKNLKETEQYYESKDFLNYLKDAVSAGGNSELYVGTIHSVKGLEYDNVFVMNVGSFNFKLDSEEMKNLFYVAITRAKNRLFVYKLFAY